MNMKKLMTLACATLALFTAGTSLAETYYWDSNTNSAGFGTAQGAWAAPTIPSGTQGWTTNSAGSTALNIVTTTNSDALNFGNGALSLGAGTITISGTVDAGDLTFASGSGAIVLSTGRINLAPAVTITLSNAADTISGVLDGAATSLTKQGTGTLTLSYNANQFTGPTVISAGKITLGAQYALWKSAYDTTGSSGALDRGTQTAPVLGGLAGSVDLATAITGYSSLTALTLNPQTGYTNTYSGVIANGSGAMTLTKTGDGAQTLTGVNSYSGATTIYDGTLGLGGAAGSALNSAFTVRGGTLSLDNSAGWTNRLADGTALSLGSLTLKSDNGGVAQTETVGPTTLATSGKVTVDNGTGAGTTLAVSGAVTRNAGAAIDFVGLGGTLGSAGANPNFTATTLPANANGILPWATVNGTQWAENNANSIRAYSSTFVDPTSAGTDATKNAQLTGSGTMGSAKSFNSLNVIASGAGQSMSLGGILTLTSPGAILKSGTDAYSITSSVANAVTAGTELIAHVDGGDLTISAPLNTAIVGLAKGGTGKLVLSGTRAGTFSGAMSIAGNLEFQGLGTTLSGAISGPGGVTVNLNSGQQLILSGTANTYSGQTIVKGGILTITYGTAGKFPGVPGGDIASQGQSLLSNLELNGGILFVGYYMSEFLGSGPGQFQITGGTSGFANTQGDASANMWTINNDASYEVVWGSPYFKPDVFVLQDATAACVFRIPNKFDLNGATRTIASYAMGAGSGRGTCGSLEGVIRDSTAGSAGITKIGAGDLQLTGANTFTGVMTINGGILTAPILVNGGVASSVGASSSAAYNLLLGPGTTLRYGVGGVPYGYGSGTGGGAASSDRSFTINGTAAGDSATLDASGTGALVLNSTATPGYGTSGQTRTLILGGSSTYTNTLAATLTDNGGAAVSVAKIGAGTWVLSGANTYTGTNILTAGKLIISATNNLGSGGLLVFNGGTLSITNTTLTSLSSMGHPIVCNPGVSVNLEIASTGNTFTVDQAIAGSVNVVKSGPGTLVFSTNNTYTGSTTINGGVLQYNDGSIIPTTPLINNSALVVNRTGTDTQGSTFHSIMVGTGTVTMANSGTLALNNINLYSGATKATNGTIALSHPLALWNSAVDTTGSGVFTLSGVTAPTIGGLTQSGAPRDLASVFTTGYSSVTNLTLNPSGTVTYGGVIADGASGMTLSMAGTGTQVLTNSNTYTGPTILKAGTLELSGSGSILNSAVTFTGGGLKLSNTSAETGSGRVHDTTGITANGGTLTYNNTSGTPNYAETVGSVALTSGQLDIVEAVNQAGAGSQTLTLAGLTQSDAAAVTFSALTTAPNATKNMIKVSGASGAGAGQNLPGGVIVGPWATAGTAANAQTDYAVYDASGYILPANITASAETTWTNSANAYTLSIPAKTAASLTVTRNIVALKESSTATATSATVNGSPTFTIAAGHFFAVGDPVVLSGFSGDLQNFAVGTVYYIASVPSGTTFTLSKTPGGTAINAGAAQTVNITGGLKLDSGINLGTYGILNSAAAPFGIGCTAAGGNVTLPAAGAGNLYVTAGSAATGSANSGLNGWIVMDAPIVNNGGALTLVKNGSGVLRLSGNNTYTGGTVINSGTVAFTNSVNFGAASSAITFNGSGALSFGPNNSWGFASGGSPDLGTHPIVVNNGAVAGLYYNSPNTTMTLSGAITGNGGIIVGGTGSQLLFNGGHGYCYGYLLSPSNSFTGPMTVGFDGNGSLTINSLADSSSPITLPNTTINFGSGAVANLLVPNRPINLVSSPTIVNQNATYTLTLGAVSTTTAGAKTLSLGAGGAGGYIAGAITDGLGQIAVTKSGAGAWALAGTNTYSGATTISSGTLVIQGVQALSPTTPIVEIIHGGTLKLLGDGTGTATYTNITLYCNGNNAGTQHYIFVGNNTPANGGNNASSPGADCTIAFNNMTFFQKSDNGNINVDVTGANGFRLQLNNVTLPITGQTTSGNITFNPTTAPITLAGTIIQASGNPSNVGAKTLVLGGTSSSGTNLITGTISDAADYTSGFNANAKPLNVTKSSTSIWLLSGTNTYTGVTTITGGKLIVNGSLATGSVVTNSGGSLAGTGTVGGTVNLTTAGAIDIRDGAVGTMTLRSGLAINGAVGANNISFDLGTAANGTDKIVVTGNVTMATSGAGVITLNQLPGTKINAGTYDLIVATGTMEPASKFTLATTAVAGNTFSLQVTGSTLQLVVVAGNDGPATTVWTGGVNTNWNNIGNWTSGTVPGIQSDAAFYNTGAGNLSTTLDADFDINSLNFNSGAVSSVTVGGTKMLTLEATNGVGLTASTPSSGTPTHTISTRVGMGSSQAWTVNTNAAVTVSGVVSDFGAGRSLTKAGAGTLTLSGINTYSGPTIINGGTLVVVNAGSINNGSVAGVLGMSSSAAGNILLGNGATLKLTGNAGTTDRNFTINGDSATIDWSGNTGGGNVFTWSSTLSPAYGSANQTRTLILTGTTGSGAPANGDQITLNANIADNGTGAVSVIKNGTGSGWLLAGANTFSGGVTINSGYLILGNASALGTGPLTMNGGGLNASSALVNSRNNVQNWNGDFSFRGDYSYNLGTGAVTLGGTRTVTMAGANTLTVSGVIGGAAGYGLTKAGAGAGALVLTTNNTYNGATTVSAGTLQLSGASGTILNSAVTTTGGALTLYNANGANNGNRVSDSAAFTMIGGTLNFNNDATANDFSESVGTLTLAGGANTVGIGQAAAGRTSTLTFASLSRTTGIINFSGTGLTNAVDNRSRITFTTPPALVNGIIGPWATVNGTAYATLDGANNVVAYAGGTLTNVTRLSSGSKIIADSSTNDVVIIEGTGTAANLTLGAATTTINSLMQSTSGGTSAATVDTASKTLQVGAITIVSGAGALTLGTAANSGTLKPATAGGTLLLVNNSANTMTVNSAIADNTSASTVTKDGSGKLLFPVTNTNTFSGGMVINAGTVENVSTNTMGTGAITIAGSASLSSVRTDSGVGRVLSNSLAVNSGATLTINNGSQYYDIGFAGVVSGNGTIAYGGNNNGQDGYSVGLLNAANTFTGMIDCLAGSVNTVCLVNSLPDSSNPIRLNSGILTLNSGVVAPLVFNGRNITLSGTGNGTINNANATATNTITINTDLLVTGVGNKTLTLGGGNTGSNTFAGRIPDGMGAVISLTKADGGTWVLTGTNTYSGATTISAGTLSINSLANVNGGASALGNPSSTANGTLSLNGVTLQYTGSGHTSDRVVNLSGTTAGAVLDASGTGPLVLTSALTATGAGIKTLTLAGSSTATNTLAGAIVDNSSVNKTSLIKTNAGTWVLAGSNTYTGTTTLRGGTLTGVTGGSCLGSSLTVTNTPGVTSALGVTVNDNTKQWSCANLAFTTNGLGSQLQFSFAVAPSTSLAPLSVTNSLTFTGAPVVVVNLANVPPGIYPLVVVGGATAPTVVPALELMGSATKGGSLAWGGTGNKTLFLTVSSKATVITFR